MSSSLLLLASWVCMPCSTLGVGFIASTPCWVSVAAPRPWLRVSVRRVLHKQRRRAARRLPPNLLPPPSTLLPPCC